MVRRIVFCLLAMVMLLGALGCTPAEQPPVEDEQQPEAPAEQGVTITDEYVIVFPQKFNTYIDRATSNLQVTLKQKTGVRLQVANERTAPVAKEIVIGQCNRFDAASATSPIMLQDDKIIFTSTDPARLYFYVEAFVDHCIAEGALNEQGQLYLTEQTLAKVVARATTYEGKLTVLTQNLRYRDDEGGNSVAQRSERFLELVLEYDPDIIGTQEATPLWTRYLQEYLSDEYTMVGVFRDGTGHGGDEANYILYRTERFTLVDSGTFWLNPADTEKVGKIEDALCNRICTWALLKDNKTGEQILACNTHLDHSTDAIRAAQLAVLFEQLSYDLGHYSVIMTGDFNMLRESEPYKAVTKAGLLDGQRNAWLDESTVDHSCHLYTDDGEIIDYCFHSKDLLPIYTKIVSDDYGGYVSDHYGVLVELVPKRK